VLASNGSLDLHSMTTIKRRTKILATLGPATDPPGVLDALLTAGVDVVRLNFSHGDPSSQVARAQAVREAAQRVGVEVGILADLPGPKIRIERFAEGRVLLKTGDRFDLVASTTTCVLATCCCSTTACCNCAWARSKANASSPPC
jgi:pyruvate kinase